LLESFLTQRDESAFEALLRRHAPMVLGICRRVLRHPQDAEDAFQATFLVLVRKAGSLRSRELLGNWLYGVAYRTAMSARAMSAKRRMKEQRAGDLPQPDAPAEKPSAELLARLDDALARLPDRYRVPVVLCELEGRSRKEVAQTLGLPEGTLSWRLAHAKKLLARRLAPYGAGAVALALSWEMSSGSASPRLLRATARAAVEVVTGGSLTAGAVPDQVVALAEGVLKAMLLSRIKGFVAVAFVLIVGVGALGLTYRPVVAQSEKLQAAPPGGRVASDDLEELRLEVAALRKSLEATRARVKALEGEVQTLRASGRAPAAAGQWGKAAPLPATPKPPAADAPTWLGRSPAPKGTSPVTPVPRPSDSPYAKPPAPATKLPARTPDDPFGEAEAALKKLRKDPGDKQAADALERALERLKRREKPED
jgi:RNA polymerase sigma factor (sigma-70 family)